MKTTCDGCEKERNDVRTVGKDSNGDPDGPSLCFICRKKGERGRVYNRRLRRYVHINRIYD
jgi:hypothetical protein